MMLEAIESHREPSQFFMKTNASKETRAGLRGVLGVEGGIARGRVTNKIK